jgi:hypothetical protein
MESDRFTGLSLPQQWRRRCRIAFIAALFALGVLSAPSAPAVARMATGGSRHPSSDPVCCPPNGSGRLHDTGPKRFSALIVTGKVSDGAIVSMTVATKLHVGLVVIRHVGGNRVSVDGVVPLGLQSVGLHKVPWNLKLDGKRLAAGAYDVLLEIFDNQGHPSGLAPTPRYASLTITSSGQDSVRMKTLP